MTVDRTAYDVVVVGGGVSGCASAYRLAEDHDVAIVEKGQVAGEASGLAAGLVAPTLFYSDTPAVARFANDWFRAFDGTHGFTFHERPRIEFIQPDSARRARRRADRLSDEGFPVSFLEPDEVEAAYPRFDASRFAGVVEYADTGWVDPHQYTVALRDAAADRGADVFTNTPVTGLAVEDDRVTGVHTESGTLSAEHVVVAAGWRIPEFLADYVDIPVRPFRLQCVELRADEPVDDSFPIGRVARDDIYFRGEPNGDLLVGGGEYFEDTPEVNASGSGIDDGLRRHVALTVPTFLPEFGEAELVNGWGGVDGATPDTKPVIDAPAATPDGVVVATGFNGLGMVNSPVAAGAVRSLVTGEDAPFPLEPLALDRFPEDVGDFELRGTFEMAGAGR